MTLPSIAANAYQNAARLAGQGTSLKTEIKDPTTPNFGDMVKSAVEGVVEQGREADNKTVDMMNGKANVVDVVTAVSETEVALQTMVSVRDKVISAYEEIMRMSI
ncbi:flagellar hook-basal body complex protein FliE [Breoghania corrubedonensis]|uniref:Flagellar hook-basal body complex protein FliE n=1 Tax=Breoghania corrubedonensis TaxID=665038 RepID=A0A2T5VDF0_9HYPH|nr:flagellar hook-basal body complex protein FliE [Breoghania corrubedonensis]PTW61765.1 flagellar hook-basal body complex protein FliE [Breoghania corrubedonensis]